MAAGSLDFLHLYLSTRRRVHADSSDAVQVFVGSQEIRFPTPTEPQGSEPPPLDSTWSILQPVTVPFDPQDPVSLELGIAGGDAWAPREALLLGGWRREGGPRFDPVAVGILRPRHEDSATATIWLSQDPSEGPARVALSRFLPVSADEPLHEFVLQLSTDRSYAQTEGSIDLKMYTLRDGIPLLVYQTQLPRTGNQEPGATGPYLHRFRLPSPGIPSSAIHTVTLTNRSDDAWGVVDAHLLGWTIDTKGDVRGGLLNTNNRPLVIVSQDIADVWPDPAPGLQFPQGWSDVRSPYALELRSPPFSFPL